MADATKVVSVASTDAVKPLKKTERNRKSSQEKAKAWSKVVIRRLPPTMTEATFRDQIQPIPDHDHMYFVAADWSLGVNATCRAYINFLHQTDVFVFKEKFDGYVFVDERGNEYVAVVEFAPFQKMVRYKARKVDRKCNTFEKSDHFQQFIATMDSEEILPKLEMKSSDIDAKRENQIRSTPLLKYLNERRSDKKGKENRGKGEKIILASKHGDEKAGKVTKGGGGAGDSQKRHKEPEGAHAGKPERSEREKAKRAERRNRRREERKKQRQQNRDDGPRTSTSKDPAEDAGHKTEATSIPPAKEVKKYSERRNENRRKTDNNNSSNNNNNNTCSTNRGRDDREADTPREDKPKEKGERKDHQPRNRRGGGGGGSGPGGDKKSQEDKKRLRNKDRPAMQIYKPGGRTNKTKEEAATESHTETVPKAAAPQ